MEIYGIYYGEVYEVDGGYLQNNGFEGILDDRLYNDINDCKYHLNEYVSIENEKLADIDEPLLIAVSDIEYIAEKDENNYSFARIKKYELV